MPKTPELVNGPKGPNRKALDKKLDDVYLKYGAFDNSAFRKLPKSAQDRILKEYKDLTRELNSSSKFE